MSMRAGWAEPGFMMSEPRIQMVAGFNYFYCEKKQVLELQVGYGLQKAVIPCGEAQVRRVKTT